MRFNTLAAWLAWQETLHPKAIDLGLARVRQVFDRLQLGASLPFTLTVGGTNGKGSCVAMLDSILRHAGYRVATYTSPHLLRYNERIRIDGREVGDERICAAFERVDQARGDITLSFFEFGTLAALDIFSGEALDLQILEVGLGGRLDAVNLIDADAALIATIDIDHQDWLGNTRDAIGLEKAGIFRPGRPAVLGDADAPASVLRHAGEQGIPLQRFGPDFGYRIAGDGWTWQTRTKQWPGLPFPALAGEHQLQNASAVLKLLQSVEDRRPVSLEHIRAGLADLCLPGRFQYFPGEVPLLLDVAHNPQAARTLAEQVRRRCAGQRVHAVFAVMRDKDIAGIIGHMRGVVDEWHLAPLAMARAAAPDDLAEIFRGLGIGGVHHGYADAASAFAAARRQARDGDWILGFGSFFLVSEFLAQRG